jgi:leucyl/phenylalanyl-tRNA--protein transferase
MTGRIRIAWLTPEDPPERFPDVALALSEPNGLLAAGGDLSPVRLCAAYRRGIFPWFQDAQPILWWSPDPRAVLFPGEMHISRRLGRTLRSGRYSVSVNLRFDEVIRGCAATREAAGTWLTPDMIAAYRQLHRLGYAHSVESWLGSELAGGVYGVALGGLFFAESMFSLHSDASKVALVKLTHLAAQHRIALIDCQVPNAHLQRLGSRNIPRSTFMDYVARLTAEAPEKRLAPEPLQATATLTQR